MDERWTLAELVTEAETRIAALPAPKNGQIRAVPDERTIRYYGTIGLLDRPLAMRGRTALYGRRHLAQVVAIKRLQTTGSSLADIQALWPTLDDDTLSRMAGIALAAKPGPPKKGRSDFWKTAPDELQPVAPPVADRPVPPPAAEPPHPAPHPRAAEAGGGERLEIQIELAPGIRIAIAVPHGGITLTPDDVRALRASAAPLVELTRRRLPDPTDDRDPRKKTNEGAER